MAKEVPFGVNLRRSTAVIYRQQRVEFYHSPMALFGQSLSVAIPG